MSIPDVRTSSNSKEGRHVMFTGYEFIARQDGKRRWLAAEIHRWTARFANRQREKHSRRDRAELAKLDDRFLRDLGVTRDDVKWAISSRLDVDAGQLLNRLARRDL